jgi:creatinine amidohydrolase/Fe(II)-dependent formamide hydrolase-like protein
VYPIMRDFHVVAPTGWYGRPELSTAERAEVIAETVADTVVRRAAEVWQALAASAGKQASMVNASQQVTA